MPSDQPRILIGDVVPFEYLDFLKYCSSVGKRYCDELTPDDLPTYCSISGMKKEKVEELKALIEAGIHPISANKSIDEIEHDATVVGRQSGFKEQKAVEPLNPKAEMEVVGNQESTAVPSQSNGDVNNTTYAELFNLDADAYANFSIIPDLKKKFSISLSNRALNCLKRAGCDSIKDLLLFTPSKLSSVRFSGSKTMQEVEQALSVLSGGTHPQPKTALSENEHVFLSMLESKLQDKPYSEDNLSESERELFAKAVDAADVLGTELCIRLIHGENSAYIKLISKMFSEFIDRTEISRRIHERATRAIACWSSDILSTQLWPYIQTYSASHSGTSIELIAPICGDCPVSDYPKILSSKANLDSMSFPNLVNLETELKSFEAWMSGIDINRICNIIFFRGARKAFNRYLDVLCARVKGSTLEELSQQWGLTTERVRQMEFKAINIIKSRIASGNWNVILLISALRNGDTVLQKSKIVEVIGPTYADLLWYCATRIMDRGCSYCLDDSLWHYDSVYDAIITFGKELPAQVHAVPDASEIEQIIAELPNLIETVALQKLLKNLADIQGYPLELLQSAVERKYKEAGKYSYKGRLTVTQMCDHVLKERFQNGFKVADKTDMSQFQRYLIESFGAKGSMTAIAVTTTITNIGVLFDRGKYIHRDYIDIDKQIVNDIFAYIESSPKTALTYSEIFSSFQERFVGTTIGNRYALQGIMKLYHSPFASHKNYISKNRKGNVDDEFCRFVKARGKVHKSEILKEFPGWKDYNIAFVLQRCTEVIEIGHGYCIHASTLTVRDDDRISMKKYLDDSIHDIPVTAKYLYDGFMDRFPAFMMENAIQSYGGLFGILQYLFSGEYQFSRPYISKDAAGEITTKSVLLQHLQGVDSIEIDDFIDLCNQHAVHYVCLSDLLDKIQPEFIRVDVQKLMRFDCIGITEDMWQDIEDLIDEAVSAHRGYLAASRITDFSCYPTITIPWTPFLLEALANILPSRIKAVKMVRTSAKIPRTIFLSAEYADDDWNSFIVKVLKSKHAAEPFASKTDILEWLQTEGLCNTKFPFALETAIHVYYDTNGKLVIQ